MYRSTIVACLGALVCLAGVSLADIPKLINYQGMLTDDGGNPLTGSYNLTFHIYDDTTGGNLEWSETQNGVQVQNGLFNVVLGKQTALNIAFGESYWLAVKVGTETMPRVRFTSVGYAYRAQIADSATVAVSAATGGGWTDDGTVVRLVTGTDSVGIGTTTPAAKLDVQGTLNVGVDENGYDVNFYGDFSKSRMFWDQSRAAFRAGRATGSEWDEDSIGTHSFASGVNTKATGHASTALGRYCEATNSHAIAMGYGSDATGYSSTAIGEETRARGDYSTAMGKSTHANGLYSTAMGFVTESTDTASTAMGEGTDATGRAATAMGRETEASGRYSTAMGYATTASGQASIAMGQYVEANSANNIVIGKGTDTWNRLVSNIPNSLMVGFNSTTPTLFVDGSSVGIGTKSPEERLHVQDTTEGVIKVGTPTDNGNATIIFEEGNADALALRYDGSKNELRIDDEPTASTRMVIERSGKVGIGTTTPGTKLAVLGLPPTSSYSYVRVSSSTGDFYISSSSKRYKEDIQPLEDDFHKILQAEPKSFIDEASGERGIGYIAEEFDGTGLENLVIYDKDGEPHGLKYELVSLYLLEIVKDLKAENEELTNRIEALEGK